MSTSNKSKAVATSQREEKKYPAAKLLKSKAFSKTLKGYSPAEVDDYIEFLIDKYTELYRENNELERKLKIVVTNFDEIRDEEEAIRSTLLKAQKLGEKIIRDANRNGVTVLLVEQTAKMALEIANRAYVLETGSIKMEGEATELANNIEVRKAYLGAQ